MAFVINFKNSEMQKQSVDIDFSCQKENLSFFYAGFYSNIEEKFGTMRIRIEYTDVTWANDIKNIFKEYSETHICKFPRRKRILEIIESKFSMFMILPAMLIISLISGTMIPERNEKKIGVLERIKFSRIR
eukprot:TRINITY_DN45602_c0_g1_i1.p1 TRINITY_DN45602_c0_g1~~TRINITY_DN45602_c0_g1_i1.p1  ORF type:complete len:148 (+),score=11.41 TRINITY_DN45602_c0_g1_i1:54-446(+)